MGLGSGPVGPGQRPLARAMRSRVKAAAWAYGSNTDSGLRPSVGAWFADYLIPLNGAKGGR